MITQISAKYSTTSFRGNFSHCHRLLDKIGEINPQTVNNLSEDIKQKLKENTPKRMRELAELNCFASTKVKKFLDKEFGENNYTLIAIGRSVSSIAELMKYMGVDVKIIPISGLRRAETNDLPTKAVKTYKNFLTSVGLTKSNLKKNSERKYILFDYAYYGRTLDKMENFLKKESILGDLENLIKMSIDVPLGKEYTNKMFNTLFSYSRFKDYSYVGKLPVRELQNVYTQASPKTANEFQGNITKGVRKLYWFNVFDSFARNDYMEINPIKEFNALYKHYLSPRAIQLYLKREIAKFDNISQT